MNILLTMIRLMGQSRYMASIDIKDAYYSFSIKDCDKKFLCFSCQGKLYQFTCLPNGLYSSAPRTFTKIFKVSLTHLHKQGHISLRHLDDFYLQGRNYEQCVQNIIETVTLSVSTFITSELV